MQNLNKTSWVNVVCWSILWVCDLSAQLILCISVYVHGDENSMGELR